MDETVKTPEEVAEQTERTFSQDEVNKIVQERIYKERQKFADYETLSEKAKELDEIKEANKTELEKANEKNSALEKELTALKAEVEIKAIREKVSLESNVPINLLNGNTEEECKAQAEAIKAYANPSYPTVKDKGEVRQGKASTREQFALYAKDLI